MADNFENENWPGLIRCKKVFENNFHFPRKCPTPWIGTRYMKCGKMQELKINIIIVFSILHNRKFIIFVTSLNRRHDISALGVVTSCKLCT
jgi:hypothetical protein